MENAHAKHDVFSADLKFCGFSSKIQIFGQSDKFEKKNKFYTKNSGLFYIFSFQI